MPKRKIETHTAKPLKTAAPIEKRDPVTELINALHGLAMKGNTAAAKLYLDYVLKRRSDEPDALSAEEALRILRETSRS